MTRVIPNDALYTFEITYIKNGSFQYICCEKSFFMDRIYYMNNELRVVLFHFQQMSRLFLAEISKLRAPTMGTDLILPKSF